MKLFGSTSFYVNDTIAFFTSSAIEEIPLEIINLKEL